MRYAFVSTRSDALGGSNVHVRDIACAVRAAGHEPHVFGGGDGAWADDVRDHGLPYHPIRHLVRPLRPHRDVSAVVELRRALGRLRPDLVSLHTAKAGAVGRLAAIGSGAPVVYTPHGWPFTAGVPALPAAVYAGLERSLAPLTNAIVNVCDFERDIALRRRVGRRELHVVIHNGMPDVEPSLRADPASTPPTLVMIARFERQKDHDTLLLALVSCTDLPWTLRLIGDGPLRGQTERRVAELQLSDRVTFLGQRRDVARQLANAQAYVLASRWEGFPRSILEAMRAGLPVVASRVGGVHEAVRDGQEGYVVPPGDPEALAQRLRRLLGDPALRERLGAAGRARYERSFTFETMLLAHVRMYESLLTERRPADT